MYLSKLHEKVASQRQFHLAYGAAKQHVGIRHTPGRAPFKVDKVAIKQIKCSLLPTNPSPVPTTNQMDFAPSCSMSHCWNKLLDFRIPTQKDIVLFLRFSSGCIFKRFQVILVASLGYCWAMGGAIKVCLIQIPFS